MLIKVKIDTNKINTTKRVQILVSKQDIFNL